MKDTPCRRLVLLSLVLWFAACERLPRAEPAGVAAARQASALDACIGAALLERAADNLEAMQLFAEGDPNTNPMVGATRAALEFSRAYQQHAQLRAAALANADSAVNHARSPADSARYMAAAERFLPRPPEPGTLEHNVSAAWTRDYAALRTDEDHRCHWDR